MSDPLEIELKLEIAPGDRERLNAAKLLASDDHECAHLVSTYFDAPDFHIRNAGYSLRIRQKSGQRVQTVKADGAAAAGLFIRMEWERAIKGDTPILDPESGLARAIGPKALASIGPLFVTDVSRTTRTLIRGGASIELAIDHGEIRAGDRSEALCEVELELGDGSPQALFDFARCLNEEVPLRLGVRSKAERGYGLVEGSTAKAVKAVKAEPIALSPDGTMGEAFKTIAHSCIRQFRLNESLVLETGKAEPLHQARVGLRRLRSALSLFNPLLTGDGRTEQLRVELRWLAAALGRVRNLDALIPRVDAGVSVQLQAVRECALAHLHGELASTRTRLLMINLAEWLALGSWWTRPADPELANQNVLAFAGDLLDASRKRVKRRGKGLASLDDEHRHRMRIEAKKLRYATEFFAALYPEKKARRRHTAFRRALEDLQDHLGELNDLVTGPTVLASLGIEAKLPKIARHERERLLVRAEAAYESLIDAKRFWR